MGSNSTTVRKRRQSPSEKIFPCTERRTHHLWTNMHRNPHKGSIIFVLHTTSLLRTKERLFCDSTIGRTLPYESESDLPIRVCPFFSPLCSLADPSLRFLPLEKN